MTEPYQFFTTATAGTFRAVAACIVPAEPGSPGADEEDAVRGADRALAERPARDRKLVAVFLRAVELLPILRWGRPFTKLAPERQARFLAFLENNRAVPKLRQGFFGLKTFALMGYYTRSATWPALGYPGPRLDAPFYTSGKEA